MVRRHVVAQPLLPFGVPLGRTLVALVSGGHGLRIVENRVNWGARGL